MSGGASNRAAHQVVVGISGVRRNAAVAVCVDGQITAACEQERVTRVRRVGLSPGSLPTEALAVALDLAGKLCPADVGRYVTAEDAARLPKRLHAERIPHHRAHAETAFSLSPYRKAAVLVCDTRAGEAMSVWKDDGVGLVRQNRPQATDGLASLYSAAAELFGFGSGQEHELEALARLAPGLESERFTRVITYHDGVLRAAPRWKQLVATWLEERSADLRHRTVVASALQTHLGAVLLQIGRDVRDQTGMRRLCLGGGLFYNTYFNTLIAQSGLFEDVFVPPNPGNAGVSLGAALLAGSPNHQRASAAISPFLGPSYDAENIKRTLDNCKLSYECLDEGAIVGTTAEALARGQLVGWFQGRMEWGHRALGNRSILANPFAPYVLENLNAFLKHRPPYRAYGVSVPEEYLTTWFAGPPSSHSMEFQYKPLDPIRFRSIVPPGTQAIRVQSIPAKSDDAAFRFRRLHEAVGTITGAPVLVNTSFNGLSEPMVCSPRDAIRVFFGSGLDLLVIDRFVIRK